jgi:glycerate kinase
LKIILAPDSFKGTLSSIEIIEVMKKKANEIFENVEVISIPLADGGEGTVDAILMATNGFKEKHKVTGPMGTEVVAELGLVKDGNTAVIEMAQASGLSLIPKLALDPLHATSYGTGELIKIALKKGCTELIVGIGGSATNDGGMGAMEALGVKFLNANGKELHGCAKNLGKVAFIDMSQICKGISKCHISVICDVNNQLLGENGATFVYGPQKGLTVELIEEIEEGMSNYASVLEQTLGKIIANMPGAGAAGGLGAAMYGFLNAKLLPGVNVILDLVNFDQLLEGTSFVVTGEGKMDKQSVFFDKAPMGIMKRCAQNNVPVLAVVGGMEEGAEAFWGGNLNSMITTVNGIMSLDYAQENALRLLENAVERMFLMVKIGMNI